MNNKDVGKHKEPKFSEELAYMVIKTHMNPYEILDMDYYMYLALYKDFYILDLMATEEGRKAIERAERLENTSADINKIKMFFNK